MYKAEIFTIINKQTGNVLLKPGANCIPLRSI